MNEERLRITQVRLSAGAAGGARPAEMRRNATHISHSLGVITT